MIRHGFAEAIVISKKMAKTAMVNVDRVVKHKKYGVTRNMTSTLMVHDELNEVVPGDKVLIRQIMPVSKNKSFIIHDIISKYKPAEFLRLNPELKPKGYEQAAKNTNIVKKKQTKTKK
jgi:small subunit ribosomal protein S17